MSTRVSLAAVALVAACAEVAPDDAWSRGMGDEPTTAAFSPLVQLGVRLFFDPRLSATGRVSCATCHDPGHAFASPDRLTDRGESGRPLARHTPTLVNVAWAKRGLFWDGGAKNLESLVLAPLTHEDEMGRADLEPVLELVARDPRLADAFRAAFPAETVTLPHVMRAIAAYERSLVSFGAPWDAGELSPRERAGEAVYARSCAGCHHPGLFTDDDFHNIGLDASFGEGDAPSRGRARVTFDAADEGKYRTPTLRNLSFSAPYMHDGRFATLEDVVEHYRHGMVPSPTLDSVFIRRSADARPGIELTDVEAADLLVFLKCLDDPRFGPDRRRAGR